MKLRGLEKSGNVTDRHICDGDSGCCYTGDFGIGDMFKCVSRGASRL